jgi:hypothetical protein
VSPSWSRAERQGRFARLGAPVLALLLLSAALAPPVAAQSATVLLYFSETGFGIDEARLADYFQRRGRVKTFGYPTSRTFRLLGLPTQFFQRGILQVGTDGAVRSVNLLDEGLLAYTRINGSTFPAADERLAAAAPTPGQPNYAASVVEFVRQNAPETFNGEPVRFFSTFNTTVSLADAFPRGGASPGLLPLLNLEIWGVPTSPPAQDPTNSNFIYQRFQRGIMHYDAACRCTQGLLLADYFKAIITGENLPPDLAEQARSSPFLRIYSADRPNGLSRAGALPDSDLREAFVRQPAPAVAAAPSASGPLRSRLRVDQGLWAAIDALEAAGSLSALNAMVRTGTEIRFGELPPGHHARYFREGGGSRRPAVFVITVDQRWRGADPKALAAIIAHEGKHLEDDLAGAEPSDVEGCIDFEIRAFTEQSLVWQTLAGPNGKPTPGDRLDQELNDWLAVYRRSPSEMADRIRTLYQELCA